MTRSRSRQFQTPTSWKSFCELRLDYLTALVTTVAEGVKRRDTAHPGFCGCIDWHSCVHGLYALLTASRLTGDPQWATIAESRLQPEQLEQELASVHRGELDHELPYGYAWFLKLAQEQERWSGKTDLLPLATELTKRLKQWVFSLSDSQVISHAQNRAYRNLSWAVLNLWEWAQFKNDRILLEALSEFTRKGLLLHDNQIPLSSDEIIDEFFPASLQRTRAILHTLPPDDARTWLESFYRNGFAIRPVEQPTSAHTAGLNFSRSWGFWDLFQWTGNTKFRDLYVEHIVTQMERPQYWRDDYKKYSHWVAQFGIYAIALSMKS